MVICDQIDFDKIYMDVLLLEATPAACFLTSYGQ
jgi:hypothetical protein